LKVKVCNLIRPFIEHFNKNWSNRWGRCYQETWWL